MDVSDKPESVVGEGMGVNELKTGVAPAWVAMGEANPEGVDACSVDKRSGESEGAGRPMLQARMNNNATVNQGSFVLIMIQLDRFKVEFLPSQNFCAVAAAIRAMDLSIQRLIFFETCHTLHLCFYRTEMEPCMFRRCAFSELAPMPFYQVLVQLGDFPDEQVNTLDPLPVRHL